MNEINFPAHWETLPFINCLKKQDLRIIFDDVVLPKPHAKAIESLRSQWSGSDKRIMNGIG